MRRYLKVFLALFSYSSKRYLEHRWNTLGALVSSTASFCLTILFVEIIFSQSPMIAGWKKEEIFLFTGIFRVFSALFSFLFLRSINFIPNKVKRGDLDFILTNPISSQFYLSFRHLRVYEFLNMLPGLGLIFYSVDVLHMVTLPIYWIILSLGMILGLFILYAIYFSIATLAIWLGSFNSLVNIYSIMTTPLSLPVDIFGKNTSFFLTFIIPLGFIVTVPVKMLLTKSPLYLIFPGGLIAVLLLYCSILFWNYSLKHYSSASS